MPEDGVYRQQILLARLSNTQGWLTYDQYATSLAFWEPDGEDVIETDVTDRDALAPGDIVGVPYDTVTIPNDLATFQAALRG